jgi:hypothetical protein
LAKDDIDIDTMNEELLESKATDTKGGNGSEDGERFEDDDGESHPPPKGSYPTVI